MEIGTEIKGTDKVENGENKEVDRFGWEMKVIIDVGNAGTGKTVYTGPSECMTMEEVQKEAEYIATHGVWWFNVLIPPHRIESITVYREEEEVGDEDVS